jgi:hypothetical protein
MFCFRMSVSVSAGAAKLLGKLTDFKMKYAQADVDI